MNQQPSKQKFREALLLDYAPTIISVDGHTECKIFKTIRYDRLVLSNLTVYTPSF